MGKKKKLFLFILPLGLVSLASCNVNQTPSDDTTIPDVGTDETPDDTTPDDPDGGTEENPDDPDETPDDPDENPDENPDNPDGDITEPEVEPLEIHSYEELIEYVENNYSDLDNQNYSIDGGLEIYYYQDSSLDTLLYSDIGVNTSVECTDDFIWYSRKMTESYYQCDADLGFCNRADESFIFRKDDGMICYDYTFVCDNVNCAYGTQNSHVCGYYSYPETYDATNLYEFYRFNDFAFSLYAFTTEANSVYTLSNYENEVETVEDSEGNISWIIRNEDLVEMMRAVGGGNDFGYSDNTDTYFLIKVNEDNQLEFNGFTTIGSLVYKFFLKINNQATETTDSLAEFLNDFTWTSTLSTNPTNTGSNVTKYYYTRQDENDTWTHLRTTSSNYASISNLEIGTQLAFVYTRDGYTFDAENSFLNNYNYEGIKYDETSGFYYVDITQHQTYIYAAWTEEQ